MAGWFLYEPVFEAATKPIREIQARRGASSATINFGDPFGPFNLKLQGALVIGLIISSPSGSTSSGLHHPGPDEEGAAVVTRLLAGAVPLFLAGAGLAWLVLPKAIEFLNAFVPEGGSTFIDARASSPSSRASCWPSASRSSSRWCWSRSTSSGC